MYNPPNSSDPFGDLTPGSAGGAALPWNEVWTKALTSPNDETFTKILSDPNANSSRAMTWVVVAGLIGYIIAFAGQLIFTFALGMQSIFYSGAGRTGRSMGFGGAELAPILGIGTICGIPIVIFAVLVGLFVSAGVAHLVARSLGGTGTFEKTMYGYAAITAPMSLVTSVVGAIPLVGCLTLPLSLYAIYVQSVALRVEHKLPQGKALLAAAALPIFGVILAVLVFLCIAVFGAALIAGSGSYR
jgi:hypothetical protein